MKKTFMGLKPNIFSFGDGNRSPEYICMYCGREGDNNPSDFGLHFNDTDVYGKKYVCSLCNNMITMSNRSFKMVLDALNEDNKDRASMLLDTAIRNLIETKERFLQDDN